MQKDYKYNSIKIITLLNVFYITVCFLFALSEGYYNGDFSGFKVNLNFNLLLLVWFICVIPYLVLWNIYKLYKKKQTCKKVSVNLNQIFIFVVFLLLIHVFIITFWGVNKVGAPTYKAEGLIKLFIQIILRFDSTLWGIFLILLLPKPYYKTTIFIAFLLFLIGVLKGYFFIFYLISLSVLIKYLKEIYFSLKKYWIVTIAALYFLSSFVSFMYEQRSIIRGEEYVQIKKESIITEKLIGRLSNFPNTAMLIDKSLEYFIISKEFNPNFFALFSLGSINTKYAEGNSPEKTFKKGTKEGYSFMLGTPGILIFSLYNSIYSFLINLNLILFFIFSVFEIFRRINVDFNIELAFLLLLFPILSGVASEYSFCFLTSFILFFTLIIFRIFYKLRIKNNI